MSISTEGDVTPTTITPAAAPAPAPVPNAPTPDQLSMTSGPLAGVQAGIPNAGAPGAPPVEGRFHKAMRQISGGGPGTYSYDENGSVTKHPDQESWKGIMGNLLFNAVAGALSGAGEHGPGATGRAVAKGFDTVLGVRQAQDANARKTAQQNFQNNEAAKLRAAQVFEANTRSLFNTAQAERLGEETSEAYVTGSQALRDEFESKGLIKDHTMSQSEITDGFRSGKFTPSNDSFLADGRTPKFDPKTGKQDGWELTFAHIADGDVSFTQDMYDRGAAVGMFTPGRKVAANSTIRTSKAIAIDQSIQGVNLAKSEMQTIFTSLGIKDTPDFDGIVKQPGMGTALYKFQSYLHASGGDPLKAIQAMSAEKQDPKTGQMRPNPDRKYANQVSAAFGGDDVLKNYHDKLDADASARKAAEEEAAKLPTELIKEDHRSANERNNAYSTEQSRLKAKTDADNAQLGNTSLTGEPYIQSLDKGTQATIRAIYDGRMELSARMLQTEKGELLAKQLNNAYQNFDASKAPAYFAARKDFTSGETSKGIENINTALGHMGQLFSVTTTSAVMPGVSELAKSLGMTNAKFFEYKKNLVADEIQHAWTHGALTDMDKSTAEGMIKEWTAKNARQGERALTELLMSKADSINNKWQNAKPSPGIPDFPVLSAASTDVVKRVLGKDVDRNATTKSAPPPAASPDSFWSQVPGATVIPAGPR